MTLAFLAATLADAATFAVMGIEGELNPLVVALHGWHPLAPFIAKAALVAFVLALPRYRSAVMAVGIAAGLLGTYSNIITIGT